MATKKVNEPDNVTGVFSYKWMSGSIVHIHPEKVGKDIVIKFPSALVEHDNPFLNKGNVWILERKNRNIFMIRKE